LRAALSRLGEREDNNRNLEKSVLVYRKALAFLHPHRNEFLMEWRRIQANLAEVLSELGSRETGVARLQEAIREFEKALEPRPPSDQSPLSPVLREAYNDFGIALETLGERTNDKATLERAIDAYNIALRGHKDNGQQEPIAWAKTLSNLSGALVRLAELEASIYLCQQAIQINDEALAIINKDQLPLVWGTIQTNRGVTLIRLFELGAPNRSFGQGDRSVTMGLASLCG
jgi:tetratricopeptide (TPR) repeat protein